ncbi:sulfite exporter TauE/SafE family protein [Chryseomicrobium sp. FSL W7-1435]|uniref:sulfite exporter TauE/SafE family protein n=1 Tax=Chryseomicrobium sp. FSL W7-1435 TaxID=2921704 RepID=UPI003159980D
MEYIVMFGIGLLATTLGTLAGGGGLISLPAMLLLGIPVHSAIGANKVSNTVSSFSSFYYLIKKKTITLKESVWLVPVSLLGGITGGLIATAIPEEQMYVVVSILLLFAFVTSFFGKKGFGGTSDLEISKKSVAGLYSIGIYDGMFGPGQGTLMLYLFSYLNISYIRAIGFVRLATFSSCFGAAATYIAAGEIIWPLTLALLVGSVAGAQAGVRIAEKLNPKYVKPILRVVTILLLVQILWTRF